MVACTRDGKATGLHMTFLRFLINILSVLCLKALIQSMDEHLTYWINTLWDIPIYTARSKIPWKFSRWLDWQSTSSAIQFRWNHYWDIAASCRSVIRLCSASLLQKQILRIYRMVQQRTFLGMSVEIDILRKRLSTQRKRIMIRCLRVFLDESPFEVTLWILQQEFWW